MAPNINKRWHCHPEVELIHFHKGSGTQFVGDHITQFDPGDIVLIGSNLPHFWKYDDGNLNESASQVSYSTVIHFHENFIGERFLYLPETKHLKILLEKAKRGLLIKASANNNIGKLIEEIYQANGLNRIMKLITCLSEFSGLEEVSVLASLGFKYDFPKAENKRMTTIYSHTFSNFQRKIMLEEVASIADMTPSSFCRYFKYHTGKTYLSFVTEIRISFACKQLIANQSSVKQICYDSGFNNFSCFHNNFKRMTGKTPQDYQKEYNK
ncbi:AraC family transcriptional regulator [Pedobacter sp. NJ-S-72]